jgi:hypothetical protein
MTGPAATHPRRKWASLAVACSCRSAPWLSLAGEPACCCRAGLPALRPRLLLRPAAPQPCACCAATSRSVRLSSCWSFSCKEQQGV